ncbi:MAG: class II aldolase/adducin family protein [Thermoleophilia bacterium]
MLTITRRGAMLGRLEPEDVLQTDLYQDDARSAQASCELPAHRAIYRRSGARAVLHTHPPFGIVLSLLGEVIEPVDVEGGLALGAVPVVQAVDPVGSAELARVVSETLLKGPLCMVRGHGLFVGASDLREAWRLSSTFEASCRIGYLFMTAGASVVKPDGSTKAGEKGRRY